MARLGSHPAGVAPVIVLLLILRLGDALTVVSTNLLQPMRWCRHAEVLDTYVYTPA